MDGKYGEVRCPAKRPHYKKRNGSKISEDFCDKLIGAINPDLPCDVMMFCSSCNSFINVKNLGEFPELEVITNKFPTQKMTGIINERI